MNPWYFLAGAVGTAIASWLLVGAWIAFSLRAKIIDVPGARSSHTRPTPRGGGVGIVAAVLASGAGLAATGQLGEPLPVFWALALAAAVALLSFIDDVRSLSSVLRLCCHAAIAFAAVRVLGGFTTFALPFWTCTGAPAWAMDVLTMVWIVGLTNVYNFMDGIDGIAGGQGAVAGLGWVGFGFVLGVPEVSFLGLGVAAASVGFLLHNWAPAKVFMGDVGSAFLGFVFALMPIVALRLGGDAAVAGTIPIFAGCVVWPFIADGAFTFVRRVRYRENVLQAHRSHLYQRLTIAGWRHAPVSLIYIAWAVASAGLGFVYATLGDIARLVTVLGLALSLAAVRWFVNGVEQKAKRRLPEPLLSQVVP